jgi:hypothetical protein
MKRARSVYRQVELDLQWKLPESIGTKTGFTFQTNDALCFDKSGIVFFLAFAAPKNLGGPIFYLVGGHDSKGKF